MKTVHTATVVNISFDVFKNSYSIELNFVSVTCVHREGNVLWVRQASLSHPKTWTPRNLEASKLHRYMGGDTEVPVNTTFF